MNAIRPASQFRDLRVLFIVQVSFLSFDHEYGNRSLVFMGNDYILFAAHAHQYTDKLSVVDVQSRHVDIRVPLTVSPGEINIVRHILSAVFLADIAFSVKVSNNLLPFFLRIIFTCRIDSL